MYPGKSKLPMVAMALLLLLCEMEAQASYGIVDFGPNSSVEGINSSGQIVGSYYIIVPHQEHHAFLYSDDAGILDLGTLGGTSSAAFAINDLGQVVGRAAIASDTADHAFLFGRDSGMIDLGTLGGITSFAYGINGNGEVVGYSLDSRGKMRAYLWSKAAGMKQILDGVGNFSLANAINNSSQIVGYYDATSPLGFDSWRSFLYSAKSGLIEIGTLGGSFSSGVAINNVGQAVGNTDVPGSNGYSHAFLYSISTGTIDLGSMGGIASSARGINEAGYIVGNVQATTQGGGYAFLYHSGAVTDLSAILAHAGWNNVLASGINDAGQIAVTAQESNGTPHALRLDPGGVSKVIPTPYSSPGPKVLFVSPMRAQAGSTDLTVSVTGVGFSTSTNVHWNGSDRSTTFVNSTRVDAVITAADLASPGTATLGVADQGATSPQTFIFAIDGKSNASVQFSTASVTVPRGQSATVPIVVSNLTGTVSAVCFNAPSGVSCSYDPASHGIIVSASNGAPLGAYTTLVVVNGASTLAMLSNTGPITNVSVMLAGLVGSLIASKGKKPHAALILLIMLVGCGGSALRPQPATTQSQASTMLSIVIQ